MTQKKKQQEKPYDLVLIEGLRSDFRSVTERLDALRESTEKGLIDILSRIEGLSLQMAETRVFLERRIDNLIC